MTKFCVTENTKSQCEKIELKNIIGRVLTVFRDFLVSFIEQSTVFCVYAHIRCL